jgi:hypothetical protein
MYKRCPESLPAIVPPAFITDAALTAVATGEAAISALMINVSVPERPDGMYTLNGT